LTAQLLWKIVGRILYRTYFRGRVVGRQHVPAEGGVIVAPNHISNLDPPIVGCQFWRHHYTVGKRELFRAPLAAMILRQWGALPVNRSRPGKELFADLVGYLQAGEALVLFPEGTRSRDGRLGKAQRGVAMLALAARVPVVPAFVKGSRRAMPRGAYLPRPFRVTVAFGPPIWPEDFTHLVDRHGRPVSDRRAQEVLTERVMAAIRGLAHDHGEEA
jgi:1-acyl-sn-glycerol-3-phosphate acyltransferase